MASEQTKKERSNIKFSKLAETILVAVAVGRNTRNAVDDKGNRI
jgi:hypothetical protein